MAALDPCGLGAAAVLARFHVVANDKWATVQQLPDDLDLAQASVYEAVAGSPLARLGGRHYVFPDGQVWWELHSSGWKRSILTPGDVETDPNWQRVEA